MPRFSQASIAFAGANAADPFQQRTEQYLTDLDLISLDFSQTDLLVLASCDTGRSEPVGYQGVGGMQLAVIVSRARSLLMALWPVNDDATPDLMREMYTNLLVKKMTKADAVRAMQVYAFEKKINPAIWASWVLYGEGW
jgi:CHAT domain-containing protein